MQKEVSMNQESEIRRQESEVIPDSCLLTPGLRSGLGILLIQLGTPDAPTPQALRSYLRQFLGDPRVIEMPRWRWWPILQLILLRRPAASAAKYRRIWDPVT